VCHADDFVRLPNDPSSAAGPAEEIPTLRMPVVPARGALAALSRGLGLRGHRAGFFVLFTASWSSFSKAVSIAFSPGLPTHL
jgi:hypothetical protein